MGCVCAQYAQCLPCTAIWHVCLCVCVCVCAQYAQCLPCTAIWHVSLCVCVSVCVCVCVHNMHNPCPVLPYGMSVCVCVCAQCTKPGLYCPMSCLCVCVCVCVCV